MLSHTDFELSSSPGVPDGVYAVPNGDLGSTFFVDSRVHTRSGSACDDGHHTECAVGHSLRLRTARAGEGVVLSMVTFNFTHFNLLHRGPFNLTLSALTDAAAGASLQVSLSNFVGEPSCCDAAGITTLTLPADDGSLTFSKLSAVLSVPTTCTTGCQPTIELVSGSTTAWIDDVVLTPVGQRPLNDH